jgi:DNA-binding transcriptional LysR family regulator
MRHLRLLQYVDEVARAGSIRKAAARLNVTASAVNRRIADLERELDAELFERRPRGVRLTAAGETFLRYVRAQSADVERMRSQIEDLKGLRRGSVRIACSQALAPDFLPEQIALYRARYPQVAFEVSVLDHERAMAALAAYDVDLVLVFRPPYLATFQPMTKLAQQLVVLMPSSHPLASRRIIRLRDCAAHPVALPERSIGGRQLLDEVIARSRLRFNIVAESNSFELLRGIVQRGVAISFQIRIGAMPRDDRGDLIARSIDDRDVPQADLVLGQLRGRNLPIPSAVFAEQLMQALDAARRQTRSVADGRESGAVRR